MRFFAISKRHPHSRNLAVDFVTFILPKFKKIKVYKANFAFKNLKMIKEVSKLSFK